MVLYLYFLIYKLTLLWGDFKKAVLSDWGPMALQCSATSNFSVLSKNILLSRSSPLIYFLKITLETSVFAALDIFPAINVITNRFQVHFSTHYYSCFYQVTLSNSCLQHILQLNFQLCFSTLLLCLSFFSLCGSSLSQLLLCQVSSPHQFQTFQAYVFLCPHLSLGRR